MKNIVLSCSQQTGNKCLLCPSEEHHTHIVASKVAELLKGYDANVLLLPKEISGTESEVLNKVVNLSNEFIRANSGKGWHLDIHTDGGYSATGSSGFFLSEGGKFFIQNIHKEVSALTPFLDGNVSKRDNLYVLRATDAVAGLIEICFHDKPNEAKWLHDNMDAIAQAITKGLVEACGLKKNIVETNKESIKKQIIDLVNQL